MSMTTDLESMVKQFLNEYRPRTTSNGAAEMVPTVAAFGIGLLVGAGVALLFAPASGEELREEISGQIGGLKNRVVGGGEETAIERSANA